MFYTLLKETFQCTVPDKSIVAWVQIDLKCPSNIFLINIFLQEMAHFNPNSFWNNVLVQNETVEKYSNVHSLVKPIVLRCVFGFSLLFI